MATTIRYVNRSVTHTSGDGTTNGTGNGGTNSYNTLADALAGLATNLTGVTCDVADDSGNNEIAMDIICTGGQADSTVINFNQAGWVTDTTHRLRVRSVNLYGGGAKWDTSNNNYYLSAAPSYGTDIITIGKAIHVDLQDIQAESTGTLDNANMVLYLADFAWHVRVIRGFYRTTGTTGTWDNVFACYNDSTGAHVLRMQNAVFATADGKPFEANGYSTTGNCAVYNCLFINRATNRQVLNMVNMDYGANCRVKNVAIQGPTGGTALYNPAGSATHATVLTQDTSAPGTSLDSKTVSFVDATNWDYHLASGDTSAKDAGTDLSGDSYWAITTDADGTVRSGTWDIGPDEISAGSSGSDSALVGMSESSANLIRVTIIEETS